MRKPIAWILLIVFAVILIASVYGTFWAGDRQSTVPVAAGRVPAPWYVLPETSPCRGAETIYLSDPPKCMTPNGLRVMSPQRPFIVPIGNLDR